MFDCINLNLSEVAFLCAKANNFIASERFYVPSIIFLFLCLVLIVSLRFFFFSFGDLTSIPSLLFLLIFYLVH